MRKNRWSIRWQLFGYLVAFVAGLLVVLWLFQVVFLEEFYKKIKINEVKEVGQKIEANIDKDYLVELLDNLAIRKQLCIVLTNADGEVLYKRDELTNSSIYHMTNFEYYLAGLNAEKRGGQLLYYFNYREFAKSLEKKNNILEQVPAGLRNKDDSVIYTRLLNSQTGNQYIVLINSLIAPVDATVSTIRKQLVYVSLIMLILAFLLAILIAKKVARPIIQINAKAKQLAVGDEAIVFEEKGYKEIAELSGTLSYASVELTKTEKLRRELIANVSHDLRTPLTLITGYAELMRDLPTENTPENVQVIVDEAKRLTQLVNDMLDLSKLQAGTSQLEKVTFNLTKQINELLLRYNTLTAQEGYTIDFIYDEEIWVNGDELKLSQVIYNLINNAINYTGSDKHVIVKQHVTNDQVRIEVIDTGEGISEEYLPYIWERYYKVDKTHKRATVGTGLGLSIVKTILDAHEAHYGVTSNIGEGSTFWFEIKLA
ncbi:ATP-binding protein [Cellulosilyticum sp. ST5]|uniref:histidine kinase n=1 Tax=Cellulosilyticum lentocellum (strain ATCC 49066 / DSM 5427 / NCIMB 11756 / RHM5) TaxID=642492 RepID=F2JLK7_CELLD|nr:MULTISPECIES: ATP-binding protein [Cellulosilyticum]ADZ83398.1 integral membrane sensor signal transduction histidine kinase [Cellulosilyticum lentocellum DSM 5427]QEH68860.1 HAMP domain-containing protein [Cellulosilyticum sp. WCF-2]